MSLLRELRRRNVIRVGAAYIVASWLIVQVATTLFPVFGYDETPTRMVVIVLAIGFIPALIVSWAFEITPEGLKRTHEVDRSESIAPDTGKKLDRMIMVVLVLALGYFAFDKFVLHPRLEAAQVEQARQEGRTEALVGSYGDKSIAVLAFHDMSPQKDQEYFSDGIAEELLNLLAKIPELRVISRSSAFSFKGKDVPLGEIAERLNVAHILEGSVRKAGNRIRITAQLIEAHSDTHLWSETYDRTLDDIFAVQDEIAADVVKELKVTLLGSAPKARSTDPQAYALFLQAVQLGRQFTAEGLEKSDTLLKQVLAIDPRYAPAWSGLGKNSLNKDNVGSMEASARAREAFDKALAIDPDYAPAHAGFGYVAMLYDNDLPAAARHLERALALDPANTSVLSAAASFLSTLGRLDETLAVDEALSRRDPVNVTWLFNHGATLRQAGRFDESIAALRTAQMLSPNLVAAHAKVGMALLLKDDAAGALAEIEQEKSEISRTIALPLAYAALGRKADSDAALAALIAKYEKDAAYNIAYVLAFRGEADQAFDWLDKAVTYGDPGLSEIALENLFDKIRSDPRWLPFLRKIDRAPEQLAKIQFKVTLPHADSHLPRTRRAEPE